MTVQLLTEYETTFILKPELTGKSIEGALDRMRSTVTKSGKILKVEHWGRKRLAYPIAKNTRGIYVHVKYLGKGDMVATLERDFRLSEDVIRFLTIKIADRVDAAGKEAVDYKAPNYADLPDETRRSAARSETSAEGDAPVKAEAASEERTEEASVEVAKEDAATTKEEA